MKTTIEKLTVIATRFAELETPLGFLDQTKECHALWMYYTMARNTYEKFVLDPIVYEDQPDPVVNFKQLFISTARVYGVKPEAMAKCWPQIDLQADIMNYPRLPNESKYRFNDNQIVVN